ncbi:glycosyltransferase family 2 protein [Propionibacteriaceae bacterium G1746]
MSDPAVAPEVSVVIPVFNGADTIGEQLDALVRQHDAPAFEVLVCDNGSTDGTRAVVKGYTERLPNLRLLHASTRRGASHARNVGILAARGRVVAFCDADDVVADDWVAAMAKFVKPGGIVVGWDDFGPLNPPALAGGVEKELGIIAGYLPSIDSANVALERNAALAIGGFDESYRYGVEDIDFGWRAQQGGLTLTREPAVVRVRHRAGGMATFRQHRNWGRGNIMLRVRHRAHLGDVMSFRYSVLALARTWSRLPIDLWRSSESDKIRRARSAGMTLGEFEGHFLFRWLGRMPAPLLLDGADASSRRPERSRST